MNTECSTPRGVIVIGTSRQESVCDPFLTVLNASRRHCDRHFDSMSLASSANCAQRLAASL